MYKIKLNKKITDGIFKLIVEAPHIAKHHKAGQFIILVNNEYSERIPLTIADSDPKSGTITILYQAIGKSTLDLANRKQDECIQHITGPLGHPTPIGSNEKVICIGGGIGAATIHPIAKALKQNNNTVISILGARSKDLLILKDEIENISNELYICTDDGSFGTKGFVTNLLEEELGKEKPNLVIAVGPVPMMKAVCDLTKKHSVKTLVSLNSLMVDGTGMCGGCRINVNNQRKFTCVDGPEFDGHEVDFDELMNRLHSYDKQEKYSKDKHTCKLEQ